MKKWVDYAWHTVMISRILSKLWTLSPVKTSFTTASVPSCNDMKNNHYNTYLFPYWSLKNAMSLWCLRHWWGLWSYAFMDAQFQAAVLNHVNAVVGVTRSEECLPLVQLDQHHVTTQLQKERFLKVSQHPAHTTQVYESMTRCNPSVIWCNQCFFIKIWLYAWK